MMKKDVETAEQAKKTFPENLLPVEKPNRCACTTRKSLLCTMRRPSHNMLYVDGHTTLAHLPPFAYCRLLPQPNRQIPRIHATRIRPAPAKVPMQVVTSLLLLNCSIKVKRRLTARLLHRKRKVLLQIHLPTQPIGPLRRRRNCKRSAKVSPPLALLDKHRDVCCLLLCLIIHQPVIRPSKRETVLRRCGGSNSRSICWRLPN
jgi:prepilin-type processing-associated H-X9-DG protein